MFFARCPRVTICFLPSYRSLFALFVILFITLYIGILMKRPPPRDLVDLLRTMFKKELGSFQQPGGARKALKLLVRLMLLLYFPGGGLDLSSRRGLPSYRILVLLSSISRRRSHQCASMAISLDRRLPHEFLRPRHHQLQL